MKRTMLSLVGLTTCTIIYFLTMQTCMATVQTPEITYPYDGDMIEWSDINIAWTKIVEADYYHVLIEDLTSGNYIENSTKIDGESYLLTADKITPGHMIRVAVNACDSDGNESGIQEITFSINQLITHYKLSGYVSDNGYLLMAGVKVLLDNNLETITDSKGYYEFNEVEKGLHELTFMYPEYTTVQETVDIVNNTKRDITIMRAPKPDPVMKFFSLGKTTFDGDVTSFLSDQTDFKIGDTLSIEGSIASNDGSIEKLTIYINGPDNKNLQQEYETQHTSYFTNSSFKIGETWIKNSGKYWIQIWAKNYNRESIMVGEIQINVEDNQLLPPEIILSQSDYIESKNEIQIKWVASRNGTPDFYEVFIYDKNREKVFYEKVLNENEMMIKSSNVDISHLIDGEKYYIELYAHKEAWEAGVSTTNFKKGNMKTPSLNIKANFDTNKILDKVTHKSITLNWSNDELIPINVYVYANGVKELFQKGIINSNYTISTQDLLYDSNYEIVVEMDLPNGKTYNESIVFNTASKPSDWAIPYIINSQDNGLLTDNVKNDYTSNITREEFCEVAVQLYKAISKDNNPIPAPVQTFSDTDNEMVRIAYGLKIVNGNGKGQFEPNAFITRQELAAMMFRTIAVSNPDIDLSGSDNIVNGFSDKSNIAKEWALKPIQFLTKYGIMNGMGDGNFAPISNATKEQAIKMVNVAYKTNYDLLDSKKE
ncbi:S-layer homology domain-containing protein [Vallitalea pronyensis]|uniref:S-layer homology domain-containing protein n=1 Tax=Vallitalea pronyensis TaxID=1348613 RepID=A0A8J8SGV2_9FIRM|nr:S-layer homology domain-containing protein [Vallitalea pronyensis]QUI22708.1 S-layer homology domain-containing protein [Vallitalea pronyensis]